MSDEAKLPIKQQAPGVLAELRSSYFKHLGTLLALGTVTVGTGILILARQLLKGVPAEFLGAIPVSDAPTPVALIR